MSPRTRTILACTILVGLCSGNDAAAIDERPSLSGLWSGTRKQIPQGTCRKQDDGESPAAISLKVWEDGATVGKDASGRGFEGSIGTDFTVTLALKGQVKCSGDAEPHEWIAQYRGAVLRGTDGYRLQMNAIEEPCPPVCTFAVEYSLRKD